MGFWIAFWKALPFSWITSRLQVMTKFADSWCSTSFLKLIFEFLDGCSLNQLEFFAGLALPYMLCFFFQFDALCSPKWWLLAWLLIWFSLSLKYWSFQLLTGLLEATFALRVLGVLCEIWVFEWPSENLYLFLEKQVDSSDDKICWLMMLIELFKADFRVPGYLFS